MTAATSLRSVVDIESFIADYYEAWSGTDEDLIMSYYADDVTVQIPGAFMQGSSAVREQFVRPFVTAFPGNRHVVRNVIFGRDVVVTEWVFVAEHKGPFAGRAATDAQVEVSGCGVYEYDPVKRQITAARIYFDVGTLLKQILDQGSPQSRTEEAVAAPTGAIVGEHLDLPTVIALSRTVTGEMVLEKLLDTLMRNAIKHAGAQRALLILSREPEQRIAAEATIQEGAVTVRLCDGPVTQSLLPETVLRHVLRTRESVILDDAGIETPFSTDPYFERRHARSVFCLPLTNQAKLIGALYLENELAPRVFAPARTAVLKLLASQAAISIENSRLYRDAAERESRIRRLVDANIIGIFIWELEGRILEANDAFLALVGYDREDLAAGHLSWTDLTPPDWRDRDERWTRELVTSGTLQPFEKEYFRKDGSRVPVLIGVAAFEENGNQGVAFVLDLTDRRRAEQRVLVQHRATRILAEAATLEEAMPKILEALCECLKWDIGAWWRIGREPDLLRCAELFRMPSVEVTQFEAATRACTFPLGVGFVGGVFSSRKPTWIPDVLRDPTFIRASAAAREGLHAALAFPIVLDREIFGVIDLFSREVRKPDDDVLRTMATLGSQIGLFIEHKREQSALQVARAELARVTRVTTIGELTASIAHEVKQPIAAAVMSAQTALRWLDAQPPELEEVREALSRIVLAGKRAGDVVGRIRALVTKAAPRKDSLEINAVIREVAEMTHGEAMKNHVSVRTDLADGLPLIEGDRVLLQQVILNLIINGIEAMTCIGESSRELLIDSKKDDSGGVSVAVSDKGQGVPTEALEQVFAAFYTTKPSGLGLGLSICRSIIEAHDGRLWASVNEPQGAVFQFTLPAAP
jgi:steroid delta-isomerase-like uncharacterized protein